MTSPTTAGRRVAEFDGLRGVAILLVVLSHGWTLWPSDGIVRTPGVGGFFSSGNFAVTIFFTVGAYLMVTGLLRDAEDDRWAMVPRTVLRRFLRLSAQVYPLILAVAVSRALDPKDQHPWDATRESLTAVATYTWNWYVQNQGALARPDLGHLWYVSVDLQWCLALAVLVFAMRRHRSALLTTLALLLVAVTAWRFHTLVTEGWGRAAVRSTTRADGLLCGALLAATRAWWAGRPGGRKIAIAGLVGILVLVVTMPAAGDDSWLRWRGVWFDVAATATVLGLAMSARVETRDFVGRVLGWRPLVWLGAMSLSVYVWHFPIFWSVSQHTFGWHWAPKAGLAMALVLAVSIVTTRWIEQPTTRWVARRTWLSSRRAQPAERVPVS
jgi:peptidoglycan/LPS O-acetylase OafA/YrhL